MIGTVAATLAHGRGPGLPSPPRHRRPRGAADVAAVVRMSVAAALLGAVAYGVWWLADDLRPRAVGSGGEPWAPLSRRARPPTPAGVWALGVPEARQIVDLSEPASGAVAASAPGRMYDPAMGTPSHRNAPFVPITRMWDVRPHARACAAPPRRGGRLVALIELLMSAAIVSVVLFAILVLLDTSARLVPQDQAARQRNPGVPGGLHRMTRDYARRTPWSAATATR